MRIPSVGQAPARGLVAALVLTLGGACAKDPGAPPRLPLDERLPAGKARAGVIERPEELLTGPTAKGRLGDFKLYNDRVAVVIGQKDFARGYQNYGGTLVDADRVRAPGEAGKSTFGEVITAFDLQVLRPEQIEVVADGRDGGPAIVRVSGQSAEVPLFSALLSEMLTREGLPLKLQVDYVLAPDRDWVELVFRLSNQERGPVDVGLPMTGYMFGDGAAPFTPGAGFATPEAGITSPYYGATGPDITYLYGRPDVELSFIVGVSGLLLASAGDKIPLRARETVELRHILVVGDGDLPAAQARWREATAQAAWPRLSGRVLDDSGAPVRGARVHVTQPEAVSAEYDYVTVARTDAEGRWSAGVPGGEPYRVLAVSDAHVESAPVVVTELAAEVALTLPRPGQVAYRVTDEAGGLLPAKLTFVREGGSLAPPARFGEAAQPAGVVRAEYGYRGEGAVDLPAGRYTVWISRGSEYEVVERAIEVGGSPVQVQATLVRSVATPGWLSTDTHVHAQLSPDSPDLYPFKVATMVVEGLELPVSTEHEWIGDFNPAIRELGVGAWIQGVVGSEITTFNYGHFNAFPLVPDPDKPGNGRIDWVKKPPGETFAAIRANAGAPFLQVNHPRSAAIGGYFSAMGLDPVTLAVDQPDKWSNDFDGIEVANGCSVRQIEEQTMPDWFAFLNRGDRKVAMGATDSHSAGKGQMGYPRTYLAMPTDAPAEAKIDDVRRAAKEGRAVIACGPFVDLAVGAARVGDTAPLNGDRLTAEATIRAPAWVDVDSVELVVNGRVAKVAPVPPADGPLDVRVTLTASVAAGRDAWVLVRVRGDERHGVWAHRTQSYGFTNPIFLDGDGDGAWRMAP
jgi:hypothetical protein